MMKTYWFTYYTKEQLIRLLADMGVTGYTIPTKKNSLYVSVANGPAILVSKSEHKGTNGKALYKYELQRWEDAAA